MTSSYPDLRKNGQAHRSSLPHTLKTSNFPYSLISLRGIQKYSQFLNIFKIWPPLWHNCALIWAKRGFLDICRTECGRNIKIYIQTTVRMKNAKIKSVLQYLKNLAPIVTSSCPNLGKRGHFSYLQNRIY